MHVNSVLCPTSCPYALSSYHSQPVNAKRRWRHRRFSLTNKRIEHKCPESNVANPAHQQNIEHFHPSRPVRHGELENHSDLVCLMLKTATAQAIKTHGMTRRDSQGTICQVSVRYELWNLLYYNMRTPHKATLPVCWDCTFQLPTLRGGRCEVTRTPLPGWEADGADSEQSPFLLFFAYSSLSCLPECVISVWLCELPRYCNLMPCLRTSPESVGHHLRKHRKAIQTGLIILNSFSIFNIFDANHLIPNLTVTRRVANIKDDEAGV